MAGNALLKEYAVGVDLKRALPVGPVEVVDCDTGSVLKVSVTDDGSPVSLEGMLVTAVFQSGKGTRLLDSEDGSITIDGSEAAIALTPAAVAPGRVACELQIRSSTEDDPSSREDYDVLVTSASFTFNCRPSMLTQEALDALPETPLLDAYLAGASAAEAARALAEAARQQAEAARAQAETARQQGFESLLAAAIGISKTGHGAPTSATVGSRGQLYFDLDDKNAYVCTAESPAYVWRMLQFADGPADEMTVTRMSTYQFADLPYYETISVGELVSRLAGWYPVINGKQDALTFDSAPRAQSSAPVTSGGIYEAIHGGDWQTVFTGALDEDVSELVLDSYSAGNGSGSFSFNELRLVIAGGMVDGTSARLFINGNNTRYMRFATFAHEDDESATVLYLHEPRLGFVIAERGYGGVINGMSYTTSTAAHYALMKLGGIAAYTGIRLLAESGAAFASGSTIILQGRKTN